MGAAIDPFLAVLKIKDLNELEPNQNEVERVFTLPLSHFKEDKVSVYQVRLEVKPSYTDEKGEEVILLPVKELGLPERYHEPWGGKNYNVYVYNTPEGIIWGVTAEIIHEMMKNIEE